MNDLDVLLARTLAAKGASPADRAALAVQADDLAVQQAAEDAEDRVVHLARPSR